MAKKMIGITTTPKGYSPATEARMLAELDQVLTRAADLLKACDKWQASAAAIADLSLTPGESRAPFLRPWVNGLRAAVAESLAEAHKYGVGD